MSARKHGPAIFNYKILLRAQFGIQNRGPTPGFVLLIGAAESKEDLKPALRRCFTHTVEVEGPDESRRLSLLFHFLGLTREAAPLSTDLQQISDHSFLIKVWLP